MKQAPTKLRQWQRDNALTDAEAGARFGTTRMTWLRWKSGDMVPSPEMMRRLYVVTQRAVAPDDFYDVPAWEAELIRIEGDAELARKAA